MRSTFWIVFIIFLVVSITPASASQISDLSNELADANTGMEHGMDDVTQHVDNVAGYGIAIKDYVIDIWNSNCFIISNSWKWWKLGDVWNHICQIVMDGYYINDNIDNTSNEGMGFALSSLMLLIKSIVSAIILIKFEKFLPPLLNTNANTQTVETTKDVTQTNDDLNTSDENDITTHNNTTQNKTNTKTTIPSNHNTPIEELHQGDVVAYKSQGKYLRYLQFITTDNQTVYLTGPYDKSITLPLEVFKKYYTGTDMRGDPKNLKASSKKVNNLYQTQRKDINNRIDQNQEKRNDTETYEGRWLFMCVASATSFVVAVVGVFILYYKYQKPHLNDAEKLQKEANRYKGLNDGYNRWAFKDCTKNAIIAAEVASETDQPKYLFMFIAVVAAILAIIGGVMWDVCRKSLNDLEDKGKKLADELADLNSWAVTENLTAPVAGCLNFTTHEGSGVNATFNGTDVYDDPLSYSNVSKPMNGNLTLTEGGFYYRSNPGFTGNDTFSYRANDDIWNLFSNVANVTVTVNPDQAPVASNMSLFTATNTPLNGFLDVNDPDNDNITCSLVDGPLHGALNLNDDGSFVYTPFDNFTGEDGFSFKANDSVLNSTIGNVTIHVVNNTSPVAYNLVFNIGQNSILNSKFDVKSINGTEQLFNIVSKPGHGVLNIFGGNFSYKPVKNYNGRDMFTYKFKDVLNQTSNLATIQIFIRSPPTAESFKLSTRMNTMINSVFKIKGYNSTSKVLSKPQHGTLTVLSNERFSYKPNKDFTGKDTFTYQSLDKLGQKSPVATVMVTVTKPKPHKLEPPKRGDSKTFSSPLSALNTPHINAPHLEALHFNLNDLNATNLNRGGLNLTNINPENPTELFTNPLTQLIKEALNKIKTTINNLKL